MGNTNFESSDNEFGLLSSEQIDRVMDKLAKSRRLKANYRFVVSSTINSDIRWARNRASMTSNRRGVNVFIICRIDTSGSSILTNQLDDVSLEGTLREVESNCLRGADYKRPLDSPIEKSFVPRASNTVTWSDRTLTRSIEEAAAIVKEATSPAEDQGFLSAGFIDSYGMSMGVVDVDQYDRYDRNFYRMTQAQCSSTVRHPQGTSSGWAGLARYDLNKIDEIQLAKLAVEKCLSSVNPVRIEPGRYTVILEPQAVGELVQTMLDSPLAYASHRDKSERGGPYFLNVNRSLNRGIAKLGLKIVDERITISHDPSDPDLGILPVPGTLPIKWIEKGVLNELTHSYGGYSLSELNDGSRRERRGSFRMDGGNTSIDEMIAGTERGLVVARFSKLRQIDADSLLATGVTRDGLWLIEKGKVSKAVRNFRITESPLFALNNVEEVGAAQPIFQPGPVPELDYLFPEFALTQVIAPTLKVRDFSFTSTIDAI